MHKLCASLVCAPLLIAGGLLVGATDAVAQRAGANNQEQQQTRQTPAMREVVYQRLSEAQECAEMEDMQCAREKLEQLGRMRDLNSYEAAQMHYFYAFIYFNAEQYDQAISSYERVLQQEELPISLEQDTKYALSQLYAQQERYRESLNMLEQWFELAENPGPTPYVLKAQIHYQIREFQEGIPAILQAVEIARQQGRDVEESWYQLLNVFYFELENFPKVIETLTFLANNWPKKDYVIQLASVYGQEGQENRMVALYEAAYEAGWLDRGQEFVNLAQMLLQFEAPYKAALLLQEGLDEGVIESTRQNWRLLSQAWQLAQEDQKALPALRRAAEMSDDGELDVMLAQSYANLFQWDECADAAREGIRRGGLDRTDQAYLLLGNCLASMREYSGANDAFEAAARDERSRSAARQWIDYIRNEQQRERELREAQRAAEA